MSADLIMREVSTKLANRKRWDGLWAAGSEFSRGCAGLEWDCERENFWRRPDWAKLRQGMVSLWGWRWYIQGKNKLGARGVCNFRRVSD